MKIACTADWHAFNFTDFSKTYLVDWNEDLLKYVVSEEPDDFSVTMNSRLFNLLDGVAQLRDYCHENGIDHILFAGDLFHHRETVDVTVTNPLYKMLSTFDDLGIQMHMIAGNHDQVDNSKIPMSSLYMLQDINGIYVHEQPDVITLEQGKDKVDVACIPYSKDKQFILDVINILREQIENPREAIMMCHLGITGGEVGSGQYSMVDEYNLKDLMYDKWKYVVCGHYHQPQCLEYNTIYTGSLLQNNFGDELKTGSGYNGFYVLDTNRRWHMEFVPVIEPRFITVTKDQLTDDIKGNYIRVKASASDSGKIKEAIENLDDIDVRVELEKEYVKEHRSDIGISTAFDDAVLMYAAKAEGTSFKDDTKLRELGLEILHEAMGGDK